MPFRSQHHGNSVARFLRVAFIAFYLGLGLLSKARADDFSHWQPAPPPGYKLSIPAEFAQDSGVVINFYYYDVDDTNFPFRRVVNKYLRFTVQDPDKARGMMDMQGLLNTGTNFWPGEYEFQGRLIQPDGTIKHFGNGAITETKAESKLATNWLEELGNNPNGKTEKTLVVPGIQKGSIVEYRVSWTDTQPARRYFYILQRQNAPILSLKFTLHTPGGSTWTSVPSVANSRASSATVTPSEGLTTITAENLAPTYDEPLSPPILQRALTVVGEIQPIKASIATSHDLPATKIHPHAGPWTSYATIIGILEGDFTANPKDFQKLADQITAGANGELEKAKKIHAYVHNRYLKYIDDGLSARVEESGYAAGTFDEVNTFEDHKKLQLKQSSFYFLAVGLYRAAGLKAQSILLANGEGLFFSKAVAAFIYLPELGIRVFVNGAWHFSDPVEEDPVPFDTLPYWKRGQDGLIAQLNKEEFIPNPASPPNHTQVKYEGKFDVTEEGGLSGSAQATWTGDRAIQIKTKLRLLSDEKRTEALNEYLTKECLATKVEVTSTSGIDDLDAPVIVKFTLDIDDYATVADDRILLRPSVFNGRVPSPLPAKIRHNPVKQEYTYELIEDVVIKFPPGYVATTTSVPAPMDAGAARVKYIGSFPPSKAAIRFQRDYVSAIQFADPRVYPALKHWYDSVANSDSFEISVAKPSADGPRPSGTPVVPAKATAP